MSDVGWPAQIHAMHLVRYSTKLHACRFDVLVVMHRLIGYSTLAAEVDDRLFGSDKCQRSSKNSYFCTRNSINVCNMLVTLLHNVYGLVPFIVDHEHPGGLCHQNFINLKY